MGGCPSNSSKNGVIKPTENNVMQKALNSQRKKDLLPPPVDYFKGCKLKHNKPYLLIMQFMPLAGNRSRKLISFLVCLGKKGKAFFDNYMYFCYDFFN
jgi:hypothetical protein